MRLMQGSVRQRARGVWEVRVYKGRHPATGTKLYVSRTVRGAKRDAQAVARTLVEEIEADRPSEADDPEWSITFGEWLDQWWVQKEKTLSPSSVSPWRSAIRKYLQPLLGHQLLSELRVRHLEAVYRQLVDGGLSPARVQKIHTVASVALNDAVRRELIAASPANQARAPKGRRVEPNPPTPDEVARLLAAAEADDPELFVFLTVAANTGARRGELCALRWCDIDFAGSFVTLANAVAKGGGDGAVVRQTKTGAVSRVAVSTRVLEILSRHRSQRVALMTELGARHDDRHFVWSQGIDGNRPVYPDTISVRFRRLSRRHGLEHVQLRQFRHYAATQLLSAGVDVRTVAGRLGHSRPATTLDRYAAFLPARDREAAELLETIHRSE